MYSDSNFLFCQLKFEFRLTYVIQPWARNFTVHELVKLSILNTIVMRNLHRINSEGTKHPLQSESYLIPYLNILNKININLPICLVCSTKLLSTHTNKMNYGWRFCLRNNSSNTASNRSKFIKIILEVEETRQISLRKLFSVIIRILIDQLAVILSVFSRCSRILKISLKVLCALYTN